MFKYDIINVAVTWLYDDLSVIRSYCDLGWKFVCYSPDGAFAYFDKRYKLEEI